MSLTLPERVQKLWNWLRAQAKGAGSRGRKHEILLREPDAANPHVRFDERDVETECSRHRATSGLYPFSLFLVCSAREKPANPSLPRSGRRQAFPNSLEGPNRPVSWDQHLCRTFATAFRHRWILP